MQSFLCMEGEVSPSLKPRSHPYNHAHSYEWASLYIPDQPGLELAPDSFRGYPF